MNHFGQRGKFLQDVHYFFQSPIFSYHPHQNPSLPSDNHGSGNVPSISGHDYVNILKE